MVFQIQKFKIAELIFISTQNTNINKDDIEEIKNRFKSIIDSFQNEYDKNYNAGFIKGDKSSLPHNAMIRINENRLVLNFQTSFKNPIFLIFDFEKRIICNYIDIKDAAFILNDKIYDHTKNALYLSRNLNKMFPNVQDINVFIDYYKNKIKENENNKSVTGTNCFEISFDDFSDIF